MLLALVMIVFGAFGLIGREFKIVGNRKVRGSTARVLGGILIVGGVAELASGFCVAAGSDIGAYLSTGICMVTLLVVIVVGIFASSTDNQMIAKEGGLPPKVSPKGPEYMICAKCGFEQPRGQTVCQKCGTPFLPAETV